MSLRKLLFHSGSALTSVIAVAGAVGLGALLVGKTGQMRGQMNRDMNQNTIVENTILDIKTYLASEANCKVALDNNFAAIGDYAVGYDAGNGVTIEEIRDKDPTARERAILFVFKKMQKEGAATQNEISSRRPDEVRVQLFDRPDPNNPAATITTCTSFETTGVETSMQMMCDTIGGQFNSTTNQCNPDYSGGATSFTAQVDSLACAVLGGVYNGGVCNVVNIAASNPGSIQSSHFRVNDIDLGGSDRLSTQADTCPNGEIATGMDRNGNLNCRAISCPQPGGAGASSYTFRNVNGNYYCQCTQDRGADIDCGARFPDGGAWGSNCRDIQVDDGCGVNPANNCTIRRKATARCPARPANIACDGAIYDECNRRVCYQGPRSNTWTPSLANTCTDETVEQTNDCGQRRTRNGTMECADDPPPPPDDPPVFACTNPNAQEGNTLPIQTAPEQIGLSRDSIRRSAGGCCMVWSTTLGCTEPGNSIIICSGGNWQFHQCEADCDPTQYTGPDPATVCSTETVIHTNCFGATRDVPGTMDCTPQFACTGPVSAGAPERDGNIGDTRRIDGLADPRNTRATTSGGCCAPANMANGRCTEPGASNYECRATGWTFTGCEGSAPPPPPPAVSLCSDGGFYSSDADCRSRSGAASCRNLGPGWLSGPSTQFCVGTEPNCNDFWCPARDCPDTHCQCGPPQFESGNLFDGTLQECLNQTNQTSTPTDSCRSLDGGRCIFLGRELPLNIECNC